MYQCPPGPWPEPESRESEFLVEAASRSHTLIFPEYFTLRPDVRDLTQIQQNSEISLRKIQIFSALPELRDTMIAAGSMILRDNGNFYNAAPVVFNGKILGFYYKRNLYKNEKQILTPGSTNLVIRHPATGSLWGFMICADVLEPSNFESYRGVDFIAIPVASPFRPDDTPEQQDARDRSIFNEGSKSSGAVLLKCCLSAFDSPSDPDSFAKPLRVQGRSLIANQREILLKAPHIRWQGILSYSTLDASSELIEYIP